MKRLIQLFLTDAYLTKYKNHSFRTGSLCRILLQLRSKNCTCNLRLFFLGKFVLMLKKRSEMLEKVISLYNNKEK